MKKGLQIFLLIVTPFAVTFLGFVVYYFIRKKTAMNRPDFNEQDAVDGLKSVFDNYGRDMAIDVEKVTRLETAHFTSLQYRKCGTGGMEAVKGSLPPYYGWFAGFFLKHPEYTPIGLTSLTDSPTQDGGNVSKGANDQFINMPTPEAYMNFLADYAIRYSDNGGILHWNSSNPDTQQNYANDLSGIIPHIVNTF